MPTSAPGSTDPRGGGPGAPDVAAVVVRVASVITDAIAVSAGFFLAWYTRYVREIGPEIDEFNFVPYSVFFPLQLWLVAIMVVLLGSTGLYARRRGIEWFDDIPQITRATALGIMILFAAVALTRYPATSRLTFILAWVLCTILIVIGRGVLQSVLAVLHRRGVGVARVLVVGGNNLGLMIMQSLAARTHLGYQVVGFLDDDRAGDFGRFQHLGGLDDIAGVATAEHVDLVIVALPAASHAAIMRIVDHCKAVDVQFKIVPDLYEMSLSQVDVDTVSGIPLIGLKAVSIQGWNAAAKRTSDVIVAAIALLVTAPLLGLLAALIKLESRGPVFYRHERIGKNRVPFTMLKFRSMRVDADRERETLVRSTEGDARLFKSREDPRRTRVGRFMRRWSLDELPQFWNVLVGDMSVVGPRPQITPEVATYEEWHYKRLAVPPGVTGLWQVSGRSELSFDEMVIYDIYYIENWSPGLDIRILLRTIPAVLRGQGAF
jgi:exopolysaccharide biosynthesis polyprenyl glycosylphosphotransferase